MDLSVKTPLILAEGVCLCVSAYIDLEKMVRLPPNALKAAIRAFIFGETEEIKSLDWRDAVLAYTLIYGGMLLFYTCDPVSPISRIYVKGGIALTKSVEKAVDYKKIGDSVILKAWSLLTMGEEETGLRLLQGATSYPERLLWRYPGPFRVSSSPLRIIVRRDDIESLRLNPSYLDEIIRPWS